MKKTRWLSAAAGTAMLVGAFALPGTGVAYAATTDGPLTSLLSGNALTAPISAPINLCGVSAAVLGGANSNCVGGASSDVTEVGGLTGVGGGGGGGGGGFGGPGGGGPRGGGGTSIGSGNNVNAPVSVPVNVCGVAAGVAGGANARCLGGASSNVTQIGSPGGGGRGAGGHGGTSILSGNNVNAPVSVPVDVCGVAIALLGEANAECIGGATTNVTDFPTRAGGGNAPGGLSVLSGNNVNAPISIPVNVCGVSLAVLGQANSSCAGGSFVNPPVCQGPRCGPPVCQRDCTPPVCQRDCTPPVCHGTDCGTCHSTVCTTCHGSNCTVCQGSDCSPPPACTAHCTPPGPGGNTPPGGNSGTLPGNNSQGSSPGGGTVASMASSLPTTGANLLAMGVAAVAALGVGAGTVVVARRRRASDAA